ncbi:hypothetical protein [Streptomyces sp. AC512_CC834]|uniref:hypothetical protein n=1 Tax=Streptomyces sp. AC512_CC834 TaxID=2823691 RepID=UPI001C25DE9A|nr:hypothetical protein [Streptomyces sp. AC512_CC834]
MTPSRLASCDETARAAHDGGPLRVYEQRVRYAPEESRQRRLDAVRSCAHIALARAGTPPLAALPPAVGRPDAPRTVHTAVSWDELVGSAQESVRQTWLPMVGRMIGLDDSAVRAVSVRP